MDTSEQYIKMCRKAIDVQELFKLKLSEGEWEGNYVTVNWKPESKKAGLNYLLLQATPIHGLSYEDEKWIVYNGFVGGHHFKLDYTKYIKDVTWFPLQHQLQKIFLELAEKEAPPEIKTIQPTLLLMHSLYKYYADWPNDIWPYNFKDVSMEQLWFNLVMNLMTEESWNGEDWINQ